MKHGYGVTIATAGPAAVEAIALDPPDVILLDVVLPGAEDGFSICRRLKNDPATRLTPLILITALSDHDSRIKGLAAGADDFLTKPVDTQELLARVGSLAHVKPTRRPRLAASITGPGVMMKPGRVHRGMSPRRDYATAVGLRSGSLTREVQRCIAADSCTTSDAVDSRSLLRRRGRSSRKIRTVSHTREATACSARSDPCSRPRHRADSHGAPTGRATPMAFGRCLPIVARIIGLSTSRAITPSPYQLTQSPEALATLRAHAERVVASRSGPDSPHREHVKLNLHAVCAGGGALVSRVRIR